MLGLFISARGIFYLLSLSLSHILSVPPSYILSVPPITYCLSPLLHTVRPPSYILFVPILTSSNLGTNKRTTAPELRVEVVPT